MKKSILAFTALLAGSALALVGCSAPAPAPAPTTAAPTTAAPTTAAPVDKEFKIGITQIVEHPSLDAAREGFKKALADAGVKATFDEKNAQGDQTTATSIANTFNTGGYDLVLAIATPTAQATAQVITSIPVLFTAVTDPVAAQLVTSNEAPGGNVTGTTDLNPVADQIKLIKQIKPEAKKVGIIYSSGEVNSEVQVKIAREAAATEGLELVEKTVTNANEVAQAANALDVDAIYVPTDNNVVSALAAVIQVAEQKKIPVVAGEGDSVAKGAVITYGLDYEKLGYQTGEMAVRILTQGADVATMPVESQKDLGLVYNSKAAERMGVTLPADLIAKGTDVG